MAVQINVAANQAALTASIQAGVQAYNQRFAQNNPINLSINSRAFSQPLGRITGDVKDFEAALAASNARVIAFGASTAVLGGVIRSFKELAVATIEVEKNLTDINRVFGLTTSQLQKFSIELFNVSKTTATSFNDASKAALEFSRQGLKAEDTLQRTKDALTLTRLAGISTANAVDALTSTVNGFAATGVTTTQILNKLVAVEQDYAVGAGDLAEALSRTGQAAQEAGVSLDQLNALVTSAQQSTARGGAVIGNALKTIFTRLQRTETLDQLEAFNIAVRDVQGNILPAVQILQNFAGAYRGLADAQRAQLSEQVAGVYQVNILKAIVNDLNKSQGVYAGALQRGASATNEAEIATAKLNKTLDALLSQTGIATQQLATNIGKVTFEPLAKYGTEQLKSFVESLNELLEGEGIGSTFANGFLKGIRNIIAGPGAIAAFFTLFKLIQNSFSYLTQALPQIAGITTESQNRKNIEASILQILQQQGPVSQALAGTMGNQAAQAQLLLQLARQQTAEYQQQTALAKSLAATLSTQGVAVKGGRGLQVTRSGGYIPSATRMAEVVGAQAGGYSPGKVVRSPVGGVMNTAEDVKYMPGFAQPFINPPADSKAGREHRKNAINRTGVDPYMYRGFIPNFAAILDVAKDPYLVKDGDTITADATIKRVRDFRLEKIDAVESNQLFGEDATNVAKRLYPKASDFAPTINASGKAAYDRLSFISEPLVNKLIDKGYGVPDLRYTNDQSLINRTEFAKKGKKGIWSEINSRGTYTHPKVIQFLDQMGIAKSEMIEDDKKDAMYKAAKAGRKKYGFESFAGFIPNFAPAVDSARVPWFKKYSSIYRNKSTDKDVFRQKDFPTFGDGSDHYYATNGNPDMMSYLYEDFLKSALNIALGSEQVVRPEQLGFKNTVTNEISNRNPFDLTRKLPGNRLQKLEAKQSKNNQKETITQITDSKFKSLLQENPELAKNVDLMTVIFNDPRYVDPTGKNPAGVLNPFEQSISSIVKNSYADVDPNTKTKLGKVTDGLIRTYEAKKNKKFGAGLFGGFIPNFSDALGGNASLMRQALGLMPFVVDLKRGTYAEGDMFHYEIANKKFLNPETKKPIYGNLGPDDIHGSTYADTFVRGFYNASSGKVDFELTEAQKKDKNFMKKNSMLLDKVKARYADRFKSAIPVKTKRVSPLSAFRNSGFIPNFADPKYIAETLKRIKNGTSGFSPQEQQEFLSKFGAEKTLVASKQQVLMSRMLMSRMVDKLGLDYINSRTVDQLNKDVKNGYMSGALNFDVPESLRFTAARGFVPNFALPIMKGYAFNNTGKIYNDVYHSDAWDSIEGSTAGAIKYAYHNGKLLLQTNKAISPELKKNFLSRGVPESAFSPVDDVDSMMRSKNTEDIEKALKENGNIHQLSSGIKAMFQRGLYTKLIKDKQSYNIPGGLSAKDLQIFGGIDGWIKYTEKNYGPLKWNAFAKGFIPNFAYKQAVMGLEESMSGNKAIFDTKPFPHIRNSSQPTFSSAIADHGGLGNALSDSMRGQKAAGLMSGGFIPNFAPKSYRYSGRGSVIDPSSGISQYSAGLGFSLADQERRARDEFNKIINALRSGAMNAQQATDAFNTLNTQAGLSAKAQTSLTRILNREVAAAGTSSAGNNSKLTKFSENLSKASTAISIAGPMLAGFAEQAVFGNRQRIEMTSGERAGQSILSTGLSAVSTGAGIGSAFGLPGTILGGAVGGLVALTSALNATTLSAEELAQLNQEQVQKSQASISAASSYIEAQKSLTQMIASGASSSDIEIATKKLSDNFNEIKDVKLQEIFNATGGDVALMTKQLQDYTNQITKESARQSGLYGKNLKPEERASALSLGLGKEGSKDFISKVRAGLLNIEEQRQKALSSSPVGFAGMPVNVSSFADLVRETETKKLAETLIPQNEPERNSKVKALTENLLNKNFEQVLQVLEKSNIVSEANKAATKFKQAATRSFNQIFLDIEQQIAKSAFDIALSFEKDSGSRRIQSAILDFSTNFQDSINSFLSNNLPDARKFDFTAATASQKAQLQLLKSQQDYDKALADQANDRSIFLSKNAENLTKEFKSSFLPSQASAEFYQKNILPQIQQGTFTGNAVSLAEQFKSASFEKAKAQVAQTGFDLSSVNEAPQVLQTINAQMEIFNQTNETNTETYKKLQQAQQALIDLQNQTALFQNQNEMTKLQTVIDTAMREKEIFEAKQEYAKKELEINKQLSDARIVVEKDIAIEKAKVDKENLMRMESMKDLSANIGNNLEIAKARSAATVNAMQRRLEDQRETFGMGRTQISERKFGIQADILKEQRKAEDAAINAEIQQRVLEMAAEQENTAATLKLNDTIMTLIETQLRGALGGEENIKGIQGMVYEMGESAQTDVDLKYGKGSYAQYQALQRIQESRIASAANNTSYNTSDFSAKMQAAGFNDRMTQAEQLTFLEKEEAAARTAGNVVLAGTIKRYQDQIKTKQQALQITRDDIDAQVRLNTEIERVNNTFAGRFRKGWGNLTSEADDLVLNLGENLPKMFGDGLVDGIKAAIRESENLGDALMGVAAKFLDEISTTLMRAGMYQILGSVGMGIPGVQAAIGKQRGGVIRAQNGMFVSGNGTGDRYPAMLENGEYVLNRRAVMAMGGPAALDTLNFSMAPRFASGGSFGFDLASSKSDAENIAKMESLMTSEGLENSPLYKELSDAEKQRREEDRKKRLARKQQRAALIGQFVAAGATLAIGAGLSNVMKNAELTKLQKISDKMQSNPYGYKFTASEMKLYNQGVSKGMLSPSGQLIGAGMNTPRTGISSVLSPKAFIGPRRQTGGLIGSRLSDTIPGYMEGGLYSSPMVKKYGTGMQNGGSSIMAAGNNSSTVNNNTNANNSFNFNTTVQRDGTIKMGANTTSYEQQDIELSKNLNAKMYAVVTEVIRKEKQFGGSLAGVRS